MLVFYVLRFIFGGPTKMLKLETIILTLWSQKNHFRLPPFAYPWKRYLYTYVAYLKDIFWFHLRMERSKPYTQKSKNVGQNQSIYSFGHQETKKIKFDLSNIIILDIKALMDVLYRYSSVFKVFVWI